LPLCGCVQTVLVQADRRSKRKPDRRDANQLGELLWINRQRLSSGRPLGLLRRVRVLTRPEREDRRVTALRRAVGCELTRTAGAVQALLRRENLQQHCPTKGIATKAARRPLRSLQLPPLDRLEMDQLLARWELLEQHKQQVEEQIAGRAAAHRDVPILRTLPGAAGYSALALAARVGPIERFPRPRSLGNYWGLTPRCRNSGETTDRLGSITKDGSALVRHLLGQLVLHVLRTDPTMRLWYKRIKQRRGSKIARVAVMRRLASIIWHMLKHREPYQTASSTQKQRRRHRPVKATTTTT